MTQATKREAPLGRRSGAFRATAVALALAVGLGGCAQSSGPHPASTINAAAPGLTPDQRTVREAAKNVTPPETSANYDWFGDNAIVILAAVGCAVGAAVGGSARSCLTGAGIGGLAGAVSRITIFSDRDNYSNDEDFVRDVSVELDRVLEENQLLVPASERLAEIHEAHIAELNRQYAAGTLSAAAFRAEIDPYLVDQQALQIIVDANNQLLTDIDRSLTGVNVPTTLQSRIQDQEGQFLGDSGRIQYALDRLSAALATVPGNVIDI